MGLILKLTSEELKQNDACEEQVEFFESEFPEGILTEWTPLHYLLCAVEPTYRSGFTWLLSNGLVPALSAPNANLYRANLYSANLVSANLYRANLESTNLYRANLYSANLVSANLESANLESANLYSANLRGAILDGADLYGADLRETGITDEQLKSASDIRNIKR